MKQVFIITACTFLFLIKTPVNAVPEYHPQGYEKRFCFAEGVMEEVLKEAAKETINSVGKHLIKKYLKDKEKLDNSSDNKNRSGKNKSNPENSKDS